MIIKKFEFIIQYITKIAQILRDELPEEDFEFVMIEQAKRILKEFFGE